MQIFPAIDIKDKKAVRLTKGDYGAVKTYNEEPWKAAEGFRATGAGNLHVVDLDGAKDGALSNFDTVKKIVEKTDAFVQVGGGIRDEERIKKYLDLGVGRVILGTAAVKNPGFLIEMVEKYKEKIAVGVDALNGKVSVGGWLETTDSDSVGFCEKLRDIGVSTAIYTDISKDGMLSGANLEIYRELAEIKGLDIIASGGVTFEDEIRSLKNMGVCGAVVGKALYEGKLSLARLLKVANG